MSETEKLLPQIPVFTTYAQVKTEIETRVNALNAITELTEDNKKEVKTGIAEINKVAERVARFRIDKTNEFLLHIQPYVDQCKELELLCKNGMEDIKAKVKTMEEAERQQKTDTVRKLYDFVTETCPYKALIKFEMFFEASMANKTASLAIIEKDLREWVAQRISDLDFIKRNCDDVQGVTNLYLENGLKLTDAINKNQEQFASEAEIAAVMAVETAPPVAGFEKKLDIVVTIEQLPQSKVKALQIFLDSLDTKWDVKILEKGN